jgi:adenylate cyclase
MNKQPELVALMKEKPDSSGAKLIVPDGQANREVILGTCTSIGRDSRNCIQIPDLVVSKEHCLIRFGPGQGFMVRDLGSSNGTFVNRMRLQGDVLLKNGDSINVGGTRLMFVTEKAKADRFSMDDTGESLRLKEIRSKAPPVPEHFLPEKEIEDQAGLRADYEKLRVTYELQRTIGIEPDLDRVFNHILEHTFEFLDCDRAVIMMLGENGELEVRALKTRQGDEKVIISSTLVNRVQSEKVGIITADALADSRFDCAQSILLQMIRSSMAVPILYDSQLLGIMIIDSSVSIDAYTEKDLALLTNIANQTAQFIKNAEMARKIEMDAVTRERFQRLLSPDLAEMVVSGKLRVEKGGESRVSTVLFADIRGFTAMSENMRAAEVLQLLNEYFEVMVDIAFRHEGTVDKFVGDMVMVVWGAPVVHEDDPVRAVRAALDMQSALIDFNKVGSMMGQPRVDIGIGINTGELVAGYIGSTRTMSYSVIGDTVNTASRLCSAAKPGEILVSENTYHKLGGQFMAAGLAPVNAKGKSKPLKVFRVLGPR